MPGPCQSGCISHLLDLQRFFPSGFLCLVTEKVGHALRLPEPSLALSHKTFTPRTPDVDQVEISAIHTNFYCASIDTSRNHLQSTDLKSYINSITFERSSSSIEIITKSGVYTNDLLTRDSLLAHCRSGVPFDVTSWVDLPFLVPNQCSR